MADNGNVEPKPYSSFAHKRLILLAPDGARQPHLIHPYIAYSDYFNCGKYPRDGYFVENFGENASIGEKAKYARLTAGLSLNELASKTGLNRVTLQKLENGRQDDANTDTLVKIALACGREKTFCCDDYHSFVVESSGNAIQEFRQSNKISQKKLAEMLDIHPHVLYQWENGKVDITRKSYNKLMTVLNSQVEMDEYNKFLSDKPGERIKELRLQYGLTQEEFAKSLNISLASLGLWERDMAEPTRESYEVLMKLFRGEIVISQQIYPPTYFGQQVKGYRTKQNLTQRQFSKLAGVSYQSVIDWEKHGRVPKVASYRRIIEVIPELLDFKISNEV